MIDILVGEAAATTIKYIHAQWFIDPKRNAAALCIYRPETFRLRSSTT